MQTGGREYEINRRSQGSGKEALLAKFDLKAAYRNVPVHPDDHWLFGMLWEAAIKFHNIT